MIENSLRQFGAGRSILLDKNGKIIAGNKTVENAGAIGLEDVIIVQTDGNKLVAVQRMDLDLDQDERAKGLAIADNRAGQVSLEWDGAVLAEMAGEIDMGQFFTEDEFAAIVGAKVGSDLLTDEDDVPDIPEDPTTKLGDLYVLGDHRLLCGNSIVVTDVERLMAGDMAHLCVTSPPYNQSIDKFKPSGMHKEGDWAAKVGRLAYADSLPEPEYQEQQRELLSTIFTVMADNASLFYNHKNRYRDKRVVAPWEWLPGPFVMRQEIIWSRPGSVTQNARMFLPCDERIYWMYKGTDFHFDDSTEIKTWSSIWKIGLETNKSHAVAFPVELPERCILACSKPGAIVLEPYGGSGTTLIACEKTGRKARLMELDPKYCDVIISRWENATGKKAELVIECPA